jgi:hypothetical protein
MKHRARVACAAQEASRAAPGSMKPQFLCDTGLPRTARITPSSGSREIAQLRVPVSTLGGAPGASSRTWIGPP